MLTKELRIKYQLNLKERLKITKKIRERKRRN